MPASFGLLCLAPAGRTHRSWLPLLSLLVGSLPFFSCVSSLCASTHSIRLGSRIQLIPSFFRLRWLFFFPPSPSVLFPTRLVGLSFCVCSVLILVQLESLEKLVTDFDEIRIQHDHYRLKVEDLAQKVCGLI